MYLRRRNLKTREEEIVSEHVDTLRGWRNAVRKGKATLGRRDWWIDVDGKLYPGKFLLANGEISAASCFGPEPFAAKSARRRPGRPVDGDPKRGVRAMLTDAQIAKANKEGGDQGLSAGIRGLIDKA